MTQRGSLQRDGRYTLHCSVNDNGDVSGELTGLGQARLIRDAELRALTMRLARYTPHDRHILSEIDLESAASITYQNHQPVPISDVAGCRFCAV